MAKRHTTTGTQREFIQGDFSTRVRLAVPAARLLALHGLTDHDGPENTSLYESVVEDLIGPAAQAALLSADEDEMMRGVTVKLEATLALGIALGMMLTPVAFDLPGGRS